MRFYFAQKEQSVSAIDADYWDKTGYWNDDPNKDPYLVLDLPDWIDRCSENVMIPDENHTIQEIIDILLAKGGIENPEIL